MDKLQELTSRYDGLVIYRTAASCGPLLPLGVLLHAAAAGEASGRALVQDYAAFLAALYEAGGDLGNCLAEQIGTDDNFYVRRVAAGHPVTPEMQACFASELAYFTELTALDDATLRRMTGLPDTLPGYRTTPADLSARIPARLAQAERYGYGEYARHPMFRVGNDGRILPILTPDPVSLSELVGYAEEREAVIRNTEALLSGGPAVNVLLCGDAGTGKSATVKAIVNRYFAEGLRLIELRKDQLCLLPEIMGRLAENPLRFILFADDLSFAEDDDGYAALKAVLEGSAAARVPNAVIYATSNRRHLVRETFSSRSGDEIHRRDSMEEMLSLSARFGLTVLFSKPSKELYLQIVHMLAGNAGLSLPAEELERRAEAFALARGGRSARTAGQFIAGLQSGTL